MLEWIDKIFVINLDQAKERLERCHHQAQQFGFKFERFPAIDGNRLTRDQETLVHPLCKHLLCSPSMIGCALSHYSILKKIVEEKIETVLVLEDDFIWYDDSSIKIDALKTFDKGMVKLSCMGPFCLYSKHSPVPKLNKWTGGNQSYLIRYKDARELLSHLKRMIYHIDFQYFLISMFKSYPIYHYECIGIGGYSDSHIGASRTKSTLCSRLLPLSDELNWSMNETILYPFGLNVHLFFLLSLLFIIVGAVLYFYGRKWLGTIFLTFGVVDLLYYFLTK